MTLFDMLSFCFYTVECIAMPIVPPALTAAKGMRSIAAPLAAVAVGGAPQGVAIGGCTVKCVGRRPTHIS